jgi:hypothetical protein
LWPIESIDECPGGAQHREGLFFWRCLARGHDTNGPSSLETRMIYSPRFEHRRAWRPKPTRPPVVERMTGRRLEYSTPFETLIPSMRAAYELHDPASETAIGANQGTCPPTWNLTFGNTRAHTREDSHYLSRDYTVPPNNCSADNSELNGGDKWSAEPYVWTARS